MQAPEAYIPTDRRQALARGIELPDRAYGSALFADISGFTALTDALVLALGEQRGAEELGRLLNQVYGALIADVDRHTGSVISFSGDAITCWFDADAGRRATACALKMQRSMAQFAALPTAGGSTVTLAVKAAVASGSARRIVVGDPQIQLIDVLAGATLGRLAAGEQLAARGEVVLDAATYDHLGDDVRVAAWRTAPNGERFAVAASIGRPVRRKHRPPELPALTAEQTRSWLLPPVFERLRSGSGVFLTELRPAVALFLRFGGIDYDRDAGAGAKLNSFIRWVQRVLIRYGGFMLQITIGDKGSYLYAAFGAPLAHEDDAVRAVAAAAELRALPDELAFVAGIQIGIARGRMRTGAYGGPTAHTYGVLGSDVNMAARLMQHAAPGEALVSLQAQAATGTAFLWDALSPLRVKGKTELATVFRLLSANRQRDSLLHEPHYALPMVGREAELALIDADLALVRRGEGRIVAVTAEAGVGKSRLLAEIVRRAADSRLATYVGACQSYGTNDSYLVWEPIWRAFFGVDSAAPPEDQVQALRHKLAALDATLLPRLPLLGVALNLGIPDNELTRSLDAKLRNDSLQALLVSCVRAHATRDDAAALMFVLEDCHWLDPLSHALLEAIGRAIVELQVLIVVAYRPPELTHLQAPHVTRLDHCRVIELHELSAPETERLIGLKQVQLSSAHTSLPPALITRIMDRSQGNPFFIEELLNYLHDIAVYLHDERALAKIDLPVSLHSLILSRIDQLSERQTLTLKVASVIGRLFRLHWLSGVHPELGEQAQITVDLEALRRFDLTPLDQLEPEPIYLFKHIITREVVYESLPWATRRLLHEQLGQFIERTYSETLDQYLDLLAYHYDLGTDEAKKREYLRKAGEASQAAYANAAAIDYYTRLLELLPQSEQIPIMLKLGQVRELVGQWAAAADIYEQGVLLAEQLDDAAAQARSESALGDLHRKRGQYAEAERRLQHAQTLFVKLKDQAGVGQVLHYRGTLLAQQGTYAAARRAYRASLRIRRRLDDRPAIASLLSNLGILARFEGDYNAARELYEASLKIRRELRDPWAIANSLNNLGLVARYLPDYDAARALLSESLAINREVGDRWSIANSLSSLADVTLDQGDYAVARLFLQESLLINQELGDQRALAFVLEDCAALAAARSENEQALRLAGAARALRTAVQAPLSPAEQTKLDRRLAMARTTLGAATATATEAAGSALSLEQAIHYAQRSIAAPAERDGIDDATPVAFQQ